MARRFNLSGNSEYEQAEVDMYADQVTDLLNELVKAYVYEKDPIRKAELTTKCQNEIIPNNLKIFEARLVQTQSGYLSTSGLTYV